MLSAVTLSRSPPRADTTMMATARLLADLPAQLEPVRLGQHQVEQHHVRLLRLEQRERLAPVGRHQRVEPAHRQVGPDQVHDVRVVLDDEHPGRYGQLTHVPSLQGPLNGQGNQEAGAALGRLQLQPSAVRGHDAAGDGQPEPGA